MLAAPVRRVLDRASRGEALARAAEAESVACQAGVEVDACHDGKPVCTVRPLAVLAGLAVFAEEPAPESVLASRRRSLAAALARPVAFLSPGSWHLQTP
jgi:hypothetical protein